MAVQDTTIQANVNNYFFKTRADYEAHASEILNNSTIYIESDGEYGNVKMNLLWENSSPSSSFAAQNITVENMSEYDYIILTNSHNDGNTPMLYNSQILHINKLKDTTYNKGIECIWANAGQVFYRVLNITSSTTISVNACYSGNTAHNDICVPQKIYGLKIVPVSDSSGGGSQVSIVDWSLGGNA